MPARAIRAAKCVNADIHVPPSKSYTNRALIAAALADGSSRILHPSESDDSLRLIEALGEFGITVSRKEDTLEVAGSGGILRAPSREINVGNAGTAMRFLAAFASLAPGETHLTGDEQMQQRPMGDLLKALKTAGIRCSSADGRPPVTIHGGNFLGGTIDLDAEVSSQYLSALLLAAPYARRHTTIRLKGKLSSLPYVDMTLYVMRSFGAIFDDIDMKLFHIDPRQHYIGHDFSVESDASAATYFLAAAAITNGRVRICNLSPDSLQGDIKFLSILADMGCTLSVEEDSVELRGGKLRGIEVDMNEIPDCVPTLAVAAAFADGQTIIQNIAHLRYKETNRLKALAAELSKLGAQVELSDDGLAICPKPLHGATIETYNDHRIAMSFAIAGLRVGGMTIMNPACVTKSFPNFWEEFAKLEG